MGLSHTVSEINGDFSRKSQKFSHPVYFVPRLTGFPLELGIGARSPKKTRMMKLRYQMIKKFQDRFSRLDTLPACEPTNEQTDRQTDTARQQRLRYAERRAGKNYIAFRSFF